MADKKEKKKNMELPDIIVSYGPKYSDETKEPIKLGNGDTVYFLQIVGFKDFAFSDEAYKQFQEIKENYKFLAKKKKLTQEQVKIFSTHLKLWARENIDNGEIVRYLEGK